MDGRHVVAEGSESSGLTWVVWARRDEPRQGDLLTVIRVSDSAGRILHAGGAAGPPLYPGHALNVSTGGSDEGPRVLVGRVAPSVRRLEVRFENGSSMDVPLYDCADVPEVRFASLLLPRDLPLAFAAGYGAAGDELERFDLSFHQGRWEARRWPSSGGRGEPRPEGQEPGRL